ncbi:c6 zinc finger domain-containing protein [Hypomontagnella monticulosa]|nr:c6 zinc finger domain-containing protein [Hypomontagnella monticulosa]
MASILNDHLNPRGDLKNALRSRNEARNRKSCDPCRERKVKCDKAFPCATCIKRGYPDLCYYRNSRSQHHPAPQSTFVVQSPETQPGGILAEGSQSSHPNTAGNRLLRDSPHQNDGGLVGLHLPPATSLMTLIQEPSSHLASGPSDRSAFERGILPLLGAIEYDTGAIHPTATFHAFLHDLLSVEQNVYVLLHSYRHRVHPFHSIPLDLDLMEKRLCAIIEFRHNPAAEVGLEMDKTPPWLCLLHAILAYGANFSELPPERRYCLTQEHMKVAFKLLVQTDYLSSPYKEAIQALLLLGNLLQDNMKPQAAWALAGTTVRLAQNLRIHLRNPRFESTSMSQEDVLLLRLAIVRQETLLSIALGRSPSCGHMDFEDDLPALPIGDGSKGLTYRQAMSWLSHIGCLHLESRRNAITPSIPLLLERIEVLEKSVDLHLKDRHFCGSAQEIEECYAFDLRYNFVISAVCRPVLSDGSNLSISDDESRCMLSRLQESLRSSGWAYVRLRTISPLARRSWAFIHNGLVSVLLLSLMKETRHNDETKILQENMISSLQHDENDCNPSSGVAAVGPLPSSLSKALEALRTMKVLTEQEATSRGSPDGLASAQAQESTVQLNEAGLPLGSLDFVSQLESWDMSEWLIPFDLGTLSAT